MVAVPNFLRKNKQLMKNLREKQTGLLTHYDVYATFQDILRNAHLTNFTKFDCEEVLRPNPSSGNSLLRPLGPHKNRTCVNTPIPTDYCMCEFEKSEKDPSKFIAMGHFAVQAINELLQKEGLANLCQTLRLDKVRTVTAYEPEKALKLYEIQFSALPSKGIYKAMIEIAPDGSFVSPMPGGGPMRKRARRAIPEHEPTPSTSSASPAPGFDREDSEPKKKGRHDGPRRQSTYGMRGGKAHAQETFSSEYYQQMLSDSRNLRKEKLTEIVPETGRPVLLKFGLKWRPQYSEVQIPAPDSTAPRFDLEKNDKLSYRPRAWNRPAKRIAVVVDGHIPSYVSAATHEIIPAAETVIYQLDDLDVRYLGLLNEHRENGGKPSITLRQLGRALNIFEMEAYIFLHAALIESMALPAKFPPPRDDTPCVICLDPHPQEGNPMPICGKCNMTCHAQCLLLDELPRGEWTCPTCEKLGGRSPPCVLCPMRGGCLLETKNPGTWAHPSCGIYLPEAAYPEPEDGTLGVLVYQEIPEQRWTMKCTVCDTSRGACMQCTVPGCKVPFHVSCGQRAGQRFLLQEDAQLVYYYAFCSEHTNNTPIDPKNAVSIKTTEKLKPLSVDDVMPRPKSLIELEKGFRQMVEMEDAVKILGYPEEIIKELYDYWVLKRADNGCRPLIPDALRFVEEMELMITQENPERDAQKALAETESLRNERWVVRTDLEKVRNLAQQVKTREKFKVALHDIQMRMFLATFQSFGITEGNVNMIPYSSRTLERLQEQTYEWVGAPASVPKPTTPPKPDKPADSSRKKSTPATTPARKASPIKTPNSQPQKTTPASTSPKNTTPRMSTLDNWLLKKPGSITPVAPKEDTKQSSKKSRRSMPSSSRKSDTKKKPKKVDANEEETPKTPVKSSPAKLEKSSPAKPSAAKPSKSSPAKPENPSPAKSQKSSPAKPEKSRSAKPEKPARSRKSLGEKKGVTTTESSGTKKQRPRPSTSAQDAAVKPADKASAKPRDSTPKPAKLRRKSAPAKSSTPATTTPNRSPVKRGLSRTPGKKAAK
ncbi:unnamed protein product, partial [Mesorhabditis spiculigera]